MAKLKTAKLFQTKMALVVGEYTVFLFRPCLTEVFALFTESFVFIYEIIDNKYSKRNNIFNWERH